MAKKQLVLSFFEYKDLAVKAGEDLKEWDKAEKDIKLGAIAVLAKDDQGRIHTHKMGQRRTRQAAILFGLIGLLSGGITVVGGAVVGGLLGALSHKNLGVPKEEKDRIDRELNGGKALLGVLVNPDEVTAVKAKLTELGGMPASYEVSDEAIEQAEVAAESTPDEAEA